MTNYELYMKFVEISSQNPFDTYLTLKSFNKDYKQTEFYKTTKLSLKKAYQIFLKAVPMQAIVRLIELTNVDNLALKISDLLNSIDEDSVNNLVDKFTTVFDINKLQEEKGDLKILLNQLKDLVK